MSQVPSPIPRHSRIAIVGHGVSALVALVTFRAEGLRSDEITIYGDQPNVLHNFRRYTSGIQQDRMRSESSGHFFPNDFPGLALLDSLRQHSPLPLLLSLCDQYQPRLDDLLAHSCVIARAAQMARSLICVRVGRIAYEPGNAPATFTLYDPLGRALCTAQHVILALGHAALRWPEPLLDWRHIPRVVHAYQPKTFRAGEIVLVVGGGMAAAHEWLAALHCGCRVIALSRKPQRHQPLNAPRCDFTAMGINAYRQLDAAGRHHYLDRLAVGSYPWRTGWEWQFARARRAGTLRHVEAALGTVEPYDERLIVNLSNGESVVVHQIVCATGFVSDMGRHSIVAQLARDHSVRIERGRLLVNDDFTVPLVGDAQGRLAVIGNLARWALPTADTFVGMKYVARRLIHSLDIRRRPAHRLWFSLRLCLTSS